MRLLVFLLLINLILGLYVTSDDNQQFYRLLKERSAENDNEYVWFTRNIPDDELKQEQLRNQQDLMNSKFYKNMLFRKHPFIANAMNERK